MKQSKAHPLPTVHESKLPTFYILTVVHVNYMYYDVHVECGRDWRSGNKHTLNLTDGHYKRMNKIEIFTFGFLDFEKR